jgi:UDP-N-acetylmuramate: L-alanyl-gamma-D-glutamyl-meso-diaminopimelate ligase
VLGVAGTHGKTTTASMLAWILKYAGYNPSFLIGGVVENFFFFFFYK